MKLTKEEVQKIALLAHLELKDEEIEKYREQLSDIFGYVNKLQEVDTSAVSAELRIGELQNVWREDEAAACPKEEHDLIFENMPDKENGQLKTIGIFKK